MLVGIHDQAGSPSDNWIAYCETHGVPYKRVNCFATDIVSQLRDCDGLLWWWMPVDPKAKLFARQLTLSLELSGKIVFPSFRTCWQYDDKIGQKYLMESTGLPLIPTDIFYDREEALTWAKTARYPKVFKLCSSSFSENVWLVRRRTQAERLIRRAFAHGFPAKRRLFIFTQRLWRLRRDKNMSSFWIFLKGIARVLLPHLPGRAVPSREWGYAYFQDFIPANNQVIYVLVLGGRACASRVTVRDGDFRASGSGLVELGRPETVPRQCIELAFRAAEALGTEFIMLEILLEQEKPLIIETDPYFYPDVTFSGFWDKSLRWHEKPVSPGQAIIEKFLENLPGANHSAPALREIRFDPSNVVADRS